MNKSDSYFIIFLLPIEVVYILSLPGLEKEQGISNMSLEEVGANSWSL